MIEIRRLYITKEDGLIKERISLPRRISLVLFLRVMTRMPTLLSILVSLLHTFRINFLHLIAPIYAFYYFGIKRADGGFYQICIDCDPNNRIWTDIDGVNKTDDGKNPPVCSSYSESVYLSSYIWVLGSVVQSTVGQPSTTRDNRDQST